MPTTDHGFHYPNPLDARAVPADVMALAQDVDEHATFRASDSADRDARFSGVKPGQLVATSQAPWLVWVKTDTSWLTVLGDTGWVTDGFSGLSGWTLDGGYAKARNRNGEIEVRIGVARSGADLTASSTGGLGDDFMVTIPPQFRPQGEGVYGSAKTYNTMGSVTLFPSGSISLNDLHANAKVATSDYVRIHLKFMEG